MRIFSAEHFWLRKLNLAHHGEDFLMAFRRCAVSMEQQSLRNLFLNRQNRIQRRHRLLENHADFLSADVLQLVPGSVCHGGTFIENFPA